LLVDAFDLRRRYGLEFAAITGEFFENAFEIWVLLVNVTFLDGTA
jgi:hypothetical protein